MFITAPQSVNVSEGVDTLFNCTGFATGQFWLINGIGPSHDNHDHRNIETHNRVTLPGGAYSYTMTVPGLTVNDNIKIECVLYVLGMPGVKSDPAYLRVQGT